MYEATLAKINHKSKGRCRVSEHVDADVDVYRKNKNLNFACLHLLIDYYFVTFKL